MKLISALALALTTAAASAQPGLESLKHVTQFHGYATQSLLYSDHNNWNSTNSTDGSLAWTEGVANLSVTPAAKLRIAAQARYSRMGTLGNKVTLDWAAADYRVNDRFGIRAGKVKSPTGLLNDAQDIDPAFLWSLLPQSVYPILSRNSLLAHYGGAVYGTLPIERLGKLQYDLFAGRRTISADDGLFIPLVESGILFPGGNSGRTFGARLRWQTPIAGLMLGASAQHENQGGAIAIPAAHLVGHSLGSPFVIPSFFGQFDHRRFFFAGEYTRTAADHAFVFTAGPPVALHVPQDGRGWYVMTSYKLTGKLSAGAYYSTVFELQAPIGPHRYQKDWAVSTRYDFNQFLYAKAEQHFMNGTALSYLQSNNLEGLHLDSRLTLLKIGVSF